MPRSYVTRPYVSRTSVARTAVTRSAAGTVPITAALNQATVASRIANVKSTAYYNTNNWTWYQFENYSHSQVNTDLTTIAADGFNDVRLVIPVQDGNTHTDIFAVPTPSGTALANLDDFIATAHTHGLTCNFTLFDHAPSSIYTNIPGCKTWIDAVVGRYSGDSRISFIDLQNEMNGSDNTQMTWARALIPYLRGAAGGIPVTISSQNPNYSKPIIDATYGQGVPLDMFNQHFYDFGRYWVINGTLTQLAAKLSGSPIFLGEVGFPTPPPLSTTVQASPTPTATVFAVGTGYGAQLNTGQPLYINGAIRSITSVSGDTVTLAGTGLNFTPTAGMPVMQMGTTLYPGPFNPSTSGVEAWQDLFLRAVQYACQQNGVPLACPWIYYDQTGSTADGYHYGLRRTDGTAKPALASQKAFMAGTFSDTSFNNGMEATDTVLPYLWYTLDGAGVAISPDTTTSHAGSTSIKFGTSVSGQFPKLVTHPLQKIVAGQSYTFSAWVKGDGACTGTTLLTLNWNSYAIDTDGIGTISSPASSAMSNSNTGWVQLSVTATAPANTAYAELFLYHNDHTGVVWFDDVAFA